MPALRYETRETDDSSCKHKSLRKTQADKIVLGGFSQGAAMALHVGFSLPLALAGVVALSGYGVRRDAVVAAVARRPQQQPKAFVGHG